MYLIVRTVVTAAQQASAAYLRTANRASLMRRPMRSAAARCCRLTAWLCEREDPVDGGLGEGVRRYVLRTHLRSEPGTAEYRIGLPDSIVSPATSCTGRSECGHDIGDHPSGHLQSAHSLPTLLAVAGKGCRRPIRPAAYDIGDDPRVAQRDSQALTDDRVVPPGGVADQHVDRPAPGHGGRGGLGQFDTALGANRGHPPVRGDHESAAQLVEDVVVLVAHHRRVAWLDVNVTDAADHGGASRGGSLGQRLTGLRVPDNQNARHTPQYLVELRQIDSPSTSGAVSMSDSPLLLTHPDGRVLTARAAGRRAVFSSAAAA